MFSVKNGYQLVNKIMIVVFALMVAYMCVWPAHTENPVHEFDDQSYRRFGGVITQPIAMINPNSGEAFTLDAGTSVIYEFDNAGNPVIVRQWDDRFTPDFGGMFDHNFPRTAVTADIFTNPAQVRSNFQEFVRVRDEHNAIHEEHLKAYTSRFDPQRLPIAIPVGLALMLSLFIVENLYERNHVFTITFGIFLLIFLFIFLSNWSAAGTLCR